jgi:hypothetical protein
VEPTSNGIGGDLLALAARGPATGFDRRIYLTNEEEQSAANTFE